MLVGYSRPSDWLRPRLLNRAHDTAAIGRYRRSQLRRDLASNFIGSPTKRRVCQVRVSLRRVSTAVGFQASAAE
jgi:hypothetical protein